VRERAAGVNLDRKEVRRALKTGRRPGMGFGPSCL